MQKSGQKRGIGSYAWGLTTFWVITNALSPCGNYVHSKLRRIKIKRVLREYLVSSIDDINKGTWKTFEITGEGYICL